MNVVKFPSKPNTNSYGTSKSIGLTLTELGDIPLRIFTLFSEQVSCVCTKTGNSLFDMERAVQFRDNLARIFDGMLEGIDEEIEENK